MVHAAAVAFVPGVVGAFFGYQVKTESIEITWAIFWWGVVTIVVLGFLGVAAQGPIAEDSEPMTKAIESVISLYGLGAAFFGLVGGLVGAVIADEKRPE